MRLIKRTLQYSRGRDGNEQQIQNTEEIKFRGIEESPTSLRNKTLEIRMKNNYAEHCKNI